MSYISPIKSKYLFISSIVFTTSFSASFISSSSLEIMPKLLSRLYLIQSNLPTKFPQITSYHSIFSIFLYLEYSLNIAVNFSSLKLLLKNPDQHNASSNNSLSGLATPAHSQSIIIGLSLFHITFFGSISEWHIV